MFIIKFEGQILYVLKKANNKFYFLKKISYEGFQAITSIKKVIFDFFFKFKYKSCR